MSEQPEALRLADALQQQAVWEGHYGPSYLRDLLPEAAAELRFLHAENEELRRERDEARRTVREAHEAGTRLTAQRDALLGALKAMLEQFNYHTITGLVHDESAAIAKARAAIKAVEEGK